MKTYKQQIMSIVLILALGFFALPVSADPLFEAAVNYGCDISPFIIETADLNGDTHLDLVTANLAGNVTVLLGIGDGTFADSVNYSTAPLSQGLDIGDMNNDGELDLVVGTDSGLVVLYGVGDGTFGTATIIDGTRLAYSLVVANLDGDNYLDIATADMDDGSATVVLSHDSTTWETPVFYPSGPMPVWIAAANLNADTNLDLAVAAYTSGLWYHQNDGAGAFTPTQILNGADVTASTVEADDLNGDSNTDLITADLTLDSVLVILSNGDGTFVTPVSYPCGAGPVDLCSADMNGDGVKDLIVANFDDSTAMLLIGVGDGTFLPDSTFASSGESASIITGDFDEDGHIDFAICNFGTNDISVFINRTSILADVENDNPNSLPANVQLSQNYPNPFNPTTTISYSLTEGNEIKLTIFNVMGQTVRTLVDRFETAGDHTEIWDGSNDAGQSLASGIYFYRLTAADGSQTRKMSLLK